MNNIRVEWNENTDAKLLETWEKRSDTNDYFKIAQDVLSPLRKEDFCYLWNFYYEWNSAKTFEDVRQMFVRTIINLFRQELNN